MYLLISCFVLIASAGELCQSPVQISSDVLLLSLGRTSCGIQRRRTQILPDTYDLPVSTGCTPVCLLLRCTEDPGSAESRSGVYCDAS
ncbi:hypothetical protein DFH09DRAFT_1181877 [Mycena vulgaris]|nr:hypothetical protein DFH09DRAFT_1181877 [Mycena vulgaris]